MSTSLLMAAALLLRNPFWPIGYEGEREAISSEPRVTQKAAPEPKDETQTARDQQETRQRAEKRERPRNWVGARKTLRISGTTTVTDDKGRKRQSVIINGLTYGNGDLISINHEGHRFTWRVQGLTEGATLRLTRLRVKDVEDEEPKGDKKQ